MQGFAWARFFAKGGGKMDDCTVIVSLVQQEEEVEVVEAERGSCSPDDSSDKGVASPAGPDAPPE